MTNIAPDHYQTIWRAVASIPGVTLDHVTSDPAYADGVAWEVGITGWSPSLHSLMMELHAKVDLGAPETLGTRIIAALNSRIATQSRRSREGLAAGTATPFSDADGWRRIAHMSIDATMAGILREIANKKGYPFSSVLHTAILSPHDELHRSATDHRGGHRLINPSIGVLDEMGERLLHLHGDIDRSGEASLPFGEPTHAPKKGASLAGEVLTVLTDERFPDSALSALAGRPVRDLASISPLVDGRTIASIEAHDGFVAAHLVPARLPMSLLLEEAGCHIKEIAA